MFRKSLLPMLVAGMGAIAIPAIAQTEGPPRQDVAVQAFGSLVTTTTQNGIDNKTTNSGGVLATYRYFFSTHYGVEADYGCSLNTQKYVSTSGVTGVNTNSHEISGSYVFRMPLRKITPFALAGAGALVFDPKNYLGASIQTRASFIYGAGTDINLTHHIFLRAEYRGFVYKSPTYDLAGLSGMGRVTHRALPSMGFGDRF